jgi:hypothetical protein
MPTSFCEQELGWNDGVEEYCELVRPPATLALQVLLVEDFAEWAPMNSADTQPQSHRCLERRRYAGASIQPPRGPSRGRARGHFLRVASLEIVETIAGWA